MPRRQITPVNSPQKDKYGDRFIPARAGNNWNVNFNLIQVRKMSTRPGPGLTINPFPVPPG